MITENKPNHSFYLAAWLRSLRWKSVECLPTLRANSIKDESSRFPIIEEPPVNLNSGLTNSNATRNQAMHCFNELASTETSFLLFALWGDSKEESLRFPKEEQHTDLNTGLTNTVSSHYQAEDGFNELASTETSFLFFAFQ